MRHSRIVQTLNVPQMVHLGPSLARPCWTNFLSILRGLSCCPRHADHWISGGPAFFPQPARIRKFSLTQAMLAEKKMTGSHLGLRRIATRDMRDWRDGRDEVGIISVH